MSNFTRSCSSRCSPPLFFLIIFIGGFFIKDGRKVEEIVLNNVKRTVY